MIQFVRRTLWEGERMNPVPAQTLWLPGRRVNNLGGPQLFAACDPAFSLALGIGKEGYCIFCMLLTTRTGVRYAYCNSPDSIYLVLS